MTQEAAPPTEADFAPPLLLELFSPEARADPYPTYRRYRETDPVQKTPFGMWSFTRYDDILAVLRDDRFSADPRNATVLEQFMPQQPDEISPIREGAGRVLLFTDPPDHTRMRNLVNKAFTRRTVENLRAHIHELVSDMCGQMSATADIIADLAYPLPALVICELMGVPTEDRDTFRGWSGEVAPILDPLTPPEITAKAVDTLAKFGDYFAGLIGERRKEPRDDLISALIQAREDEDQLSEEELMSILGLVFIAGHETTQNLIGNGLFALLRHRDQWQKLCDDPALVRNAVEELLRFDSPVQLTARSATTDIEVGGETVGQGEEVIVILGAGNRDPDHFPDPDTLDVEREKPLVLSFGAGHHFCLGAPLARLEAQLVFTELCTRFPNIDLVTDDPPWRGTLTLRGLEQLEVTL